MTRDEWCFIDTNVLVYSTVSQNPWHTEAREWLVALHDAGLTLCVTPQILREYLVVLTRGTLLQTLTVLDETGAVASALIELLQRYPLRGKRIHDANIVAAMLTHGITRLATYNLDDFTVFQEITLQSRP